MGNGIRYGVLSFFLSAILNFSLYAFTNYRPANQLGTIVQVLEVPPCLLFFSLIAGAVVSNPIEELLFRYIPLKTVMALTPMRILWWATAFAFAGLFGAFHYWFSALHGAWQNLLIQGVAGLIYSKAFIVGGYKTALYAHWTCSGMVISLLVILYYLNL